MTTQNCYSHPQIKKKLWWFQPVKAFVRILPWISVDRLSADYSDPCWTLTSGRSGCLWGGGWTVPLLTPWGFATAGHKFPVFRQSAAKPWMEHLEEQDPVCLCPLVSEEEQILGAFCAAIGAIASSSDALTQLQTQSRSLSLVSASHCLWVPPGKQFFLESVLISVLLCWLSHPKPCQPYQPQEPWWPWGTCWPFQASRNSFSSCVIPKASRSACWYSHTRSLAAEGNLK